MRPAIKTSSGRIVPAPELGLKHKDIPAQGQRGFIERGKFLNRQEAAIIAKIPGVTSLHSTDLPAYKRMHRK